MSRARSLLTALFCVFCSVASGAQKPGKEVRLLFTGDILLSRQVRAELERRQESPWKDFENLFREADWVAGNLEGAVGPPEDCLPSAPQDPCFAVPETSVTLLRAARFRAASVENNHASDLGAAGRRQTRRALERQGLLALSYEDSPAFLRFGEITVAIISLSAVRGRDGKRVEIPSIELRRKLRLARRLSNLVMVSVHWGSELIDWPTPEQRRGAEWLIRHGADVIFGHHPHVIQAPECVLGKPVFYSLGNHLFDQKYPASKEGLVADCRIVDGKFRCGGIATRTPPGTSFPRNLGSDPSAEQALSGCEVSVSQSFTAGGFRLRPQASAPGMDRSILVLEAFKEGRLRWKTRPSSLVSLEPGRLAGRNGPELLFALERHRSSLDDEEGLRPYVYALGPAGLIARWRGSALAWPLLDAGLLPGTDDVICALHRRDSFITLRPDSAGTRVAAYRWNGFGFSGLEDTEVVRRCRELFDAPD